MKSRIIIGTSKNVRFAIADTSSIVKNAKKYSDYNEMFLTSEIALLNIASILSMNIKSDSGKIALVLKADGMLGNAKALAKYDGRVIANCNLNQNDIIKINNVKNIDEFKSLYKIGKGTILVETNLGLKTPYITGLEINEDETIEEVFEKYYKNSEQLKTIIKTSIKFNDNNEFDKSGALIIQLLPNSDENIFDKYEEKMKMIYNLTELLAHDFTLEKVADLIFENIEEYNILETKNLEFACECNKENFKNLVLNNLEKKEINEILSEEGYVETVCGFCNRVYRFEDFS
ncbi:Hsp33 family molecular chaperone HslO [Oceanivirga salmonicida]|uniref:Hsp33 family molecular chaperone HslO n=1 Tax=Oceanivirga salmonicida TaxID=1769291 RepID=UPI0018CC4B22|nr:Hsp33 family molecular chaperone HslO [Oceanivirga salmonicida]